MNANDVSVGSGRRILTSRACAPHGYGALQLFNTECTCVLKVKGEGELVMNEKMPQCQIRSAKLELEAFARPELRGLITTDTRQR